MAVDPANPVRHKAQKTSLEVLNFNIDFADVLAAAIGSPSLANVTSAVVDIPNGDPIVGIVSNEVINGDTIEFQVQNGTADTEYLITFFVTLNDGQILEECVELLVKNC